MDINNNHAGLRIIVADDHALVRGGLVMMIDLASPGAEVLQANSLQQVMGFFADGAQIDLLLLDLMMPGMNGEAGIKAVRDTAPDVPIIIVSVHEDLGSIRRSMAAGAAGYVPKTSTPNVTVSAIRLVLDGGIYVPPHILNFNEEPSRETSISDSVARDSGLTRRQLEVIDLIEAGKSNNTIAEELGLSTGTVKMHVSGIFKKLNAASRTEAVAIYSKIKSKSNQV